MTMQTAANIVEIAKTSYAETVGVKELLTAILEATTQQTAAFIGLNNTINIINLVQSGGDVYHSADPSLAELAMSHTVASGKLNTLLMTLACVLESLGEEIHY
jgi:hypothetical protein